MKRTHVSKSIMLAIVGQLIAALLLVWVINLCVDQAVTHFREGRMARGSESGLQSITAEVSALQKSVSTLQTRIARQEKIQCPSVQDLKDLAARYHLRLGKLERQTQTAKAEATRLIYSVVCIGGLEDQVVFLKELEDNYVVQSDNIALQRYNEDGTILALGLSLTVREP